MPIQGFQPKTKPEGEGYNSPALEEGSYQCVIEKIELREGTKYMSTETEMQLLFYFKPLDVPEEFKSKILFYQTTTSFFNGISEKARAGVKASKLYSLIKTVYKLYKPDVDVSAMKPEDITDEILNDLEGKQLIAIVKINANGNNKVTDIMSAKSALPVGDDVDSSFDKDLEI